MTEEFTLDRSQPGAPLGQQPAPASPAGQQIEFPAEAGPETTAENPLEFMSGLLSHRYSGPTGVSNPTLIANRSPGAGCFRWPSKAGSSCRASLIAS